MINYLNFEVVIKLNYFPFKGGSSPYYIPHIIVIKNLWTITKIAQLYLEHFSKKIIATIQQIEKIWTLYGIYLQSLDKIQVGHEIFYL